MILGVQGPNHLGHVLNLTGIWFVRKVNGQAINHDPILWPHGFDLVYIDEFLPESPYIAFIEAHFGDLETRAL